MIVQDIIAMLFLMTISAMTMQTGTGAAFTLQIVLTICGLLGFAWVASRYLLPRVMAALAHEKELMLLFVITWAIVCGSMWYYFGFSMEIGSLLAGITLASSRYRFHVFSELRPFRDFFLALFFVYLGGQILFDDIGSKMLPIIAFSLFVLLGNPMIIVALMMQLGYNRKDSFMTGLTVAQISEFSFIMISLAIATGTLSDSSILSSMTIVGLITMTGSSYMFAHAERLYALVSPLLQKFEKKQHAQPALLEHHGARVIVIGYGRLGAYISSKLKEYGVRYCVIESRADKIQLAERRSHPVVYGDVSDHELLLQLLGEDTQIVYSTVADYDTNVHILQILQETHFDVELIALSSYLDEAEGLYNHGAEYVISPHMAGAYESWEVIERRIWRPDEFISSKLKNRQDLQVHKAYLEQS
ncbi:MAG: cation:proton antiporter [Candidatus Peribacteria bacterium]|nr:MAG: cation:proton antiporter [Candidatus Peribacteria bacterium]